MSPEPAGIEGDAAAEPFGAPITWHRNAILLEVAADRTLGSVLRLMRVKHADWVVVVRPVFDGAEVYYYAFHTSELQRLAADHPERLTWPMEEAMAMHEWTSSQTARGRRPLGPPAGNHGPAAARIVDLDAAGRVAAVGERDEASPRSSTRSRVWRFAAEDLDFDLGPMRGGGTAGSGAADPPGELEVTLSAETEAEIGVGSETRVAFQIELTSEAMPLAASQPARAEKDVPIIVSLSIENDALAMVRSHVYTEEPPAPGQPRTGFFTVKGVRPGVSRLAVTFRQGGTELGTIGLGVEVVPAQASADRAQGRAVAASRDVADDDKLALMIEQRVEGNEVFYEYTLHSEALGLPYRRERSQRLLDGGGGPAGTALAFVERIYQRVTRELKSYDDLRELQREARALGASLCEELFDPAVATVLWPLRDRITLIQIVSWEPFIPWELVRLRDPVSGDIDDRFLCEYGLVRTLSDEPPSRTLPMDRWAYLGAEFPMGSFPPVGAELDYFTKASPDSLRGRAITPVSIAGTRDDFYDALAGGDFDVLHISCHAQSRHQSIDQASLIIGDESLPGDSRAQLIEVDATTVAAEAQLRKRRPLVFLNGCETGRVGPVMTAWGGWPNVFLRRGAGAFVGSAWAVRDRPAAVFATSFYNALLDGKTLAEAASEARAAAKQLGDASWLAFKVYGHPRARRAPR